MAYSGSVPEGRWDYNEYNPSWDERIRFTVRSLSSDHGGGSRDHATRVDGVGLARGRARDGTTRLRPAVTAREGRHATSSAPTRRTRPRRRCEGVRRAIREALIAYTSVKLPQPGETATSGPQRADAREHAALGRDNVFVPLRGDPASGLGRARGGRHPALPLRAHVRPHPDAHGGPADGLRAVKNVERYLQDTFTYSERVPTRPIPLMGFLYEDKRGYCQQFSGAMALMLRMAGIPPAWPPASRRARTTRTPASTACATSTRTPGWRCGSPVSAGSRSTRLRRARRRSRSPALLATSAAAADAGEVRLSARAWRPRIA